MSAQVSEALEVHDGSSVAGRHKCDEAGRRGARAWYNWAAAVAGVVSFVLLGRLLAETYRITAQGLPEGAQMPYSTENLALEHEYQASSALAGYLVIAGAITVLLVVWPRRHRRTSSAGFVIGAVLAVTALALAAATYWPCRPHGNPIFPIIGWVLSMFEGDVEFVGPGAQCALTFPPGFELARTLAFVVIAYAAVEVVRVFARQQMARIRIAWHGDVDVVVGLYPETLPLIKALTCERQHRHRFEGWVDARPAWLGGAVANYFRGLKSQTARGQDPRLSRVPLPPWRWRLLAWTTGLRQGDLGHLIRRRTMVVVIDRGKDNPLAAEARRLGAVVLVDDATSDSALRLVVVRRNVFPRRVSLRRIYAATWDMRTNLEVWEALQRVLADVRPKPRQDAMDPRVFLRINDTREARQWRLENLRTEHAEVICDAITPVGLAASHVARAIIPATESGLMRGQTTEVLVVGESVLWLALLDELAWEQWARYEVGLVAWEQATEYRGDVVSARRNLANLASPSLRSVTLYGPKAEVRKAEWERTRAPWSAPDAPEALTIFDVEAGPIDDWEAAVRKRLAEVATATAVIVDDSRQARDAGARLAREFPASGGQHRVIVRSYDRADWHEPVVAGGQLRYVPRLVLQQPYVEDGQVRLRDVPPPDFALRLARQQHTVFRGAWPSDPNPVELPSTFRQRRRHWQAVLAPEGSAESDLEVKVTARDWYQLPRFFQEENLRALRGLLKWYEHEGWEWGTITDTEAQALTPSQRRGLIEPAAGAVQFEYQRWDTMRRENGWWYANRSDTHRLSDLLTGWDCKPAEDKAYDTKLLRWQLRRLYAMGIVARGPGFSDAT